MLPDRLKERVEKATVTVSTTRQPQAGRGVLVPGGFILTAAHCVTWSCEDDIKGGLQCHFLFGLSNDDLKPFIVEIEAFDGTKLYVVPYAVEPVNDISVLGRLDGQRFYEAWERYEDWHESIKPVPLYIREYKVDQEFDVFILTHEGKWLDGRACYTGASDHSRFSLELTENIKGGTSGSPIVNEYGKLVGIVSSSLESGVETEKKILCPAVRASHALPVWIVEKIRGIGERRRIREANEAHQNYLRARRGKRNSQG